MPLREVLKLVKLCYPNIKPFMRQNILFILLTQGVVLLSLAIPLIIRYLIDEVLTEHRWDMMYVVIIAMGATIVFMRIFAICTNILYNRFAANIEAKARESLFSRILLKKMSFFDKTQKGEIVDRLMATPEELHQILSIHLERIISSSIMVIAVFVITFSMHPVMAFVSLIAAPIFVIVYIKTRGIFFNQIQRAREETSKLTSFYVEALQNVSQTKNLTSESKEQETSNAHNNEIKRLGLRYAITGAFVNNSVQFITQINQLGVLAYGAWLIYTGDATMTIGILMAFYAYLEMLYGPLVSIVHTLDGVNNTSVAMKRYLEFYNNDYEEDYESGSKAPPASGKLVFTDVNFSYADNKVLDNFCLQINPGEKILLTGRSGSGKSTIASLVKRLYDIDSGNISLDGQGIYDINLQVLRKSIAYIMQDDYFHTETVRDSFKRLNPNISDDEIIKALEASQMHREVFEKDGALDFMLQNNAVAFSGGQRKRLSLAMLFVSDAKLVILDEPFAGIDKTTATEIWEKAKVYLKNKTVIVIEHNFLDTGYFDRTLDLGSSSENKLNTSEELS
ncbi:MAG: ABC transporter ATP-binding protein/permease [Defluviitaleaceae bacterium]|nr:ABC transporter ATP-binding protein/permease [Defluviitaleaceae bacterium]